jgi:hypothetical protein
LGGSRIPLLPDTGDDEENQVNNDQNPAQELMVSEGSRPVVKIADAGRMGCVCKRPLAASVPLDKSGDNLPDHSTETGARTERCPGLAVCRVPEREVETGSGRCPSPA